MTKKFFFKNHLPYHLGKYKPKQLWDFYITIFSIWIWVLYSILDINFLSDRELAKTLSHSVGFPFHRLIAFLAVKKLFSFVKYHLLVVDFGIWTIVLFVSKAISLKSRKRQGYLLFAYLFNIVFEVLAFSVLNHPCISGLKPCWSRWIYFWIQFASILLSIFASMFIREIGLKFSFFIWSLCCLDISIIVVS